MNAPLLRFVTSAPPLAPTNDRVIALGTNAAAVLRHVRPDTRTLAGSGHGVAGFDLAGGTGRAAFVAALRLRAGGGAVRAALAWCAGPRAPLGELALLWSRPDAAPSRLVVAEAFVADALALARALPEAARQIEDVLVVGAAPLVDLVAALPNLRTAWWTAASTPRLVREWELATRGRREERAPFWLRARGVGSWSRHAGVA